MYILWKQRLFLLTVVLSIACLFSACMMNITPSLKADQLMLVNRSPHNIPRHNPPHVSATRVPAIQTNCPTSSRAAVHVSLNEGARQNIIYTYNTSSNGLLMRYDITSKKKTTLLNLNNATISNAQLSTDGQFILFVTQVGGQLAIQMVRVDGQDLQTLYCAPTSKAPVNFIDNLLWSPDQQRILFRVPDPAGGKTAPILQLLDLAHGSLQTVLAPSGNIGYIPRVWPDANIVYMQGYALNDSDSVPPHDVYVLDLSHKSVRQVASIAGYDWDLSLTPDGKQLLLAQGAALPPGGQPQPPSFISTQEVYGGSLHITYASHVYAVTQVRAISTKTLLFVLGGRFASGEQNGLWRINISGSGLKQLTKDGKLLSDQHTIWSDISRDGHLYAVASYTSTPGSNSGQTALLYGALSGGPATVIDTTDASDNAEIVGWTML